MGALPFILGSNNRMFGRFWGKPKKPEPEPGKWYQSGKWFYATQQGSKDRFDWNGDWEWAGPEPPGGVRPAKPAVNQELIVKAAAKKARDAKIRQRDAEIRIINDEYTIAEAAVMAEYRACVKAATAVCAAEKDEKIRILAEPANAQIKAIQERYEILLANSPPREGGRRKTQRKKQKHLRKRRKSRRRV